MIQYSVGLRCKINYAASVNLKMPHDDFYIPFCWQKIPINIHKYIHKAIFCLTIFKICGKIKYTIKRTIEGKHMGQGKKTSSDKIKQLKEQGALNLHPERVKDDYFLDPKLEFFDPNDLVQVKYEMLRSVEKEGVSVTEASKNYGFSRPAFYQVQSQFQKNGISGFVREKPGPKSAYKLTPDIMKFINGRVKDGEPLRARELAKSIKKQFNKDVHPRSIERAIARKDKRRGDKKK